MAQAQKFMMAAVIFVLLFSVGMGTMHCLGLCETYPHCFDSCKKFGYLIGECIPPERHFCCCANITTSLEPQNFPSRIGRNQNVFLNY
uniref:Defensin-like protein 73 n=1 Tax=Cicer arietinum TaxID=3827 RepID=A0A1S3EIM4_CICAR|nr:putative defensin-like protein 73 [Cicer arietinum]